MIPIFLFTLGAAIGSFANAGVWRLRHNMDFLKGRSECEYCHHLLGPSDLVPILSWLLLRGRCRYCHLKLSIAHPIVETVMGVLFVLSYLWWPGDLNTPASAASFVFWLIYLAGVAMLFLYDLRWQLLPNKILFPLVLLAVIELLAVKLWLGHQGPQVLVEAVAGIVTLGGFFGLLYVVSKGRWIGLGDAKLGIFMGIVLGMPGSLIALLSAYYIAAAVVLPLLPLGKVSRKSHVPFGPFLLAAFFISQLFSHSIVHWWQTTIMGA